MSSEKLYVTDEVEVVLKDKNGNIKAIRKSKSTIEEINELIVKIIKTSQRP